MPNYDEIEFIAAIYYECHGNIQNLALTFELPIHLLERNPPQDAEDFVVKLLQGFYHQESSDYAEANKATLRKELPLELKRQASTPKRTNMKVCDGTATQQEIDYFARAYGKCNGDLQRLTRELRQNLSLMRENPPLDGGDFGRKILSGVYAV